VFMKNAWHRGFEEQSKEQRYPMTRTLACEICKTPGPASVLRYYANSCFQVTSVRYVPKLQTSRLPFQWQSPDQCTDRLLCIALFDPWRLA